MQAKEIHQFLNDFFTANDCPMLTSNDHYLIVQLTDEMDKRIMNRPFYWQYIEQTGEAPQPAQLTLITDAQQSGAGIIGEVIHFGSPRLKQLFQVTKEKGSFVRMYEGVRENEEAILTPWLVINYKIIFESHRVREEIYSLGMNLMTGDVYKAFQEKLAGKPLQDSLPPHHFCLPPTISYERAIERLDHLIERHIVAQDQSWATEAQEKFKKEKLVLDYFYEDKEEKPRRYRMELEALTNLYEARIHIEVVNGGCFYLNGQHQ